MIQIIMTLFLPTTPLLSIIPFYILILLCSYMSLIIQVLHAFLRLLL